MTNQTDGLIEIVGAGNVADDAKTLAAYSKDMSFAAPMRPRCVVKPQSEAQVEAIVNWANQTATPLVPVSSGPPHFRGATVPSTGGSVIVDLSGMKEIKYVNGKERCAVIEPGVTFGELQAALAKEGLRLNMPLLPRSTKSVLASVMEREPVTMPTFQWNAGDPLGGTQVILADGTPFSAGAAGDLDYFMKEKLPMRASVGPNAIDYAKLLQGAQGTFGIVTWISLVCERIPTLQEPFLLGSSDLGQLMEFTYWVARRRLVEECVLLNSTDFAAIMAKQWPEQYLKLRDDLPPWILSYSINGYQYFPEENIAWQLDSITSIAKQLALTPVKGFSGIGASDMLKLLYQPSDDPHWKLAYKGACQDIFFITTSDNVSQLVDVMKDSASQCGYPVADLGVYVQPCIQGANYYCEFNLFYDPGNAKETAKVQRLLVEASEALMAKGAFFSRPYGPWADMVYSKDAETTSLLRKVKNIFDPNNIMNPGKLCF